jgi:hypothetical protein
MALSFLYVAFVRLLQLFRLRRRERDELAIEVVMLRHEVAILRRQVNLWGPETHLGRLTWGFALA